MNNSYNYADFIGLNLDTSHPRKRHRSQALTLESTDPTAYWVEPSIKQDRKPVRQTANSPKPL